MEDIDKIFADVLFNEEVSSSEKESIDLWKEKNDGNRYFESSVQYLKKQKESGQTVSDKEFVFKSIEGKIQKKGRRRLLIRLSSIAASLIFIIGFVFLFIDRGNIDFTGQGSDYIESGKAIAYLTIDNGKTLILNGNEGLFPDLDFAKIEENITLVYDSESVDDDVYHTINVPKGGEFNVVLSDNTKVFLNAGSSLSYPARFTGQTREVTLYGEGFFEVDANKDFPFVVNALDVTLTVTGTSFNVNAYQDRNKVTTTLVTGLLTAETGNELHSMSPGYQVVYDGLTGESIMQEVDTEMYTSWKDGYYYFEDTPLEEIMDNMILWYNLEVVYESDYVKSLTFGGRFKRYDNVFDLLKKLEYTQDLEFNINDRVIKINSKKTD